MGHIEQYHCIVDDVSIHDIVNKQHSTLWLESELPRQPGTLGASYSLTSTANLVVRQEADRW